MMKVLQMVTQAYRATIEEQDDTILWLTQAMKGAGGDFDVLLSGNAVNYAVPGQDAAGLSIGDWTQTQPPRIEDDLARMTAKGITVFAIEEDLAERGLAETAIVTGIQRLPRADTARLMGRYDQVWRW
jgi:sulfur relay (sulfurtransferase) DsrF/TusC family protein